jgi:hypothetical protein
MDPANLTYTALSGEGVGTALKGILWLVRGLYEYPVVTVAILLMIVLIVVVGRMVRGRGAAKGESIDPPGSP